MVTGHRHQPKTLGDHAQRVRRVRCPGGVVTKHHPKATIAHDLSDGLTANQVKQRLGKRLERGSPID